MKKKYQITIGVIILIAALSVFLDKASNKRKSLSEEDKPVVSTKERTRSYAESQTEKKSYEKAFSEIQPTKEELAAKPEGVEDTSWLRTVFFHRASVQDKNGEVLFFGRIIDQEGRPIPGVKVTTTSRVYDESLAAQVEHGFGRIVDKSFEVTTDLEGEFSISGFRGRTLQFKSFLKDDYSQPSSFPKFSFSPSYPNRHNPNSQEPVVFTMWKKGETEPLTKSFMRKRIAADGRETIISLRENRVVGNEMDGDLRIKISANYRSENENMYYPWSVEVESTSGGLTLTQEEFPNYAPESGYVQKLSWNAPSNGGWTRDLRKAIYVKSENDSFYASVAFEFKIFHTNSASVVLRTLINPSGSRNLTFDPLKEIK